MTKLEQLKDSMPPDWHNCKENSMLKKLFPCCLALVFGALTLHAAEPEAKLKVNAPTAVPGSTLEPGSYTLSVVDHLSDRYILRVVGGSGAERPTFLGIPNPSLKASAGEIKWGSGPDGTTYLKGWNFGGAAGTLEFVYPKDEAVALAKANNASVAAIDPASEGRVSNNGLSKEDMQMVTLWLLSPTHVGPNNTSGGIKAERYQQVASVTPHKPVVSRLPHTASYLPLVMLAGLLSLAAAAGLRLGSLARS